MNRILIYFIWLIVLCLMIGLVLGYCFGVRINLSPSMPMGLWHIVADKSEIKRSDFVLACIPLNAPMMKTAIEQQFITHGICQGGFQPLLKKVGAVQDDEVILTKKGISVNGNLLSSTATFYCDRQGHHFHPTQRGRFKVKHEQYWLIANHPLSFDSRYFGPIVKNDIIGVVIPLWIFEENR